MNGTSLKAYSHLAAVLTSRKIAIPELRRQMRDLGVPVNIKSLYRLASTEPLQKVDLRIVGAICRTCQVGIQDVIDFSKPKLALERLEDSAQKRLDQLMSKNNEGALSAAERKEFEELAERAHQITMANARLLAAQRRGRKTPAIVSLRSLRDRRSNRSAKSLKPRRPA